MTRIPRQLLMCPRHWAMVNMRLQKAVYAAHRQIDDDLGAYLLAADRATLAAIDVETGICGSPTDLMLGAQRQLRERVKSLEAKQQ